MIWEILEGEKDTTRRQLYTQKIICGCIYRSFSDFEANIFFRFMFNECYLLKKDLYPLLEEEGRERLDKTLKKFKKYNICENDDGGRLNKEFAEGVENYIKNPQIQEQQAPQSLIEDEDKKITSFSLLGLLFSNENQSEEISIILKKCFLEKINEYDHKRLSRPNFEFICADVSTKIGILIKGFLSYANNYSTIVSIIKLNMLDPAKYYKITPQQKQIINILWQLRLVKKTPDDQYFRITQSLHHFAFESKRQSDVNSEIDCQITIETNFKVYAKIKSHSMHRKDFKTFKGIMRKLIELDYEDFEIEELIMGKITQSKARQIFREGITSSQYFNFFKQYIDSGASLEKDLGRWKKLKFLGLQGPADESVIPNNVRQEIKLWESIFNEQKYDL